MGTVVMKAVQLPLAPGKNVFRLQLPYFNYLAYTIKLRNLCCMKFCEGWFSLCELF